MGNNIERPLRRVDRDASVLTINQDEIIQKGIIQILKSFGLKAEQIRAVPDTQSALNHLLRTNKMPNLIFLDIVEGNNGGWNFLNEFHHLKDNLKDPRFEHVQLVALSASDDPNIGEKCKQKGAAGFIAKPFSIHQIVETARQLLPMNIAS